MRKLAVILIAVLTLIPYTYCISNLKEATYKYGIPIYRFTIAKVSGVKVNYIEGLKMTLSIYFYIT